MNTLLGFIKKECKNKTAPCIIICCILWGIKLEKNGLSSQVFLSEKNSQLFMHSSESNRILCTLVVQQVI